MRVSTLVAIILFLGTVDASAIEMTREGKTIDVPVCGGFLQIPCGPKQYCAYPVVATCGMGDQFGKCEPRPELCPEIIIDGGVCGCNGKDYGNDCFAAQGGTSVAHVGPCKPCP
jgi:hypothetical protein